MTPTNDPNRTTPPNDPRDDLAAYGIGATDHEESLAVKHLLTENPELQREAAEYAAAATALIAGVPRVEPPADLKNKIMAAARASSRPTVQTLKPVTPPLTVLPKTTQPVAAKSAAGVNRGIMLWVAAVAAVVLFGMNVYWITQLNQMRQSPVDQIASADFDTAVALLTAPGSHHTELTDSTGDAKAMIVWSPEHNAALMVAHSLPALDDDQIYQIWMIDQSGTPMSAGIFDKPDDTRYSMLFETPVDWDGVAAMGISVEPPGGSEQPTTTPIALAEM